MNSDSRGAGKEHSPRRPVIAHLQPRKSRMNWFIFSLVTQPV